MAVLVTGAGLVGCHVARRLAEHGEQVVLCDTQPDPARLGLLGHHDGITVQQLDLLSMPDLLHTMRRHEVRCIVHTAALTSLVWQQPHRGVTVNIGAVANLLEAARLQGVDRVVFSSTSSVYGLGRRQAGEYVNEDTPLLPCDVYGVTKVAGEQLGGMYERLFGITFCTLRYPLVVPPADRSFHTVPSTAIARAGAVIPTMVATVVRGEEFTGSDWPRMEWVYVEDVAGATLLAATRPNLVGRTWNLGSGEPCTLGDFASTLREVVPGARITLQPSSAGMMAQLAGADAGEPEKPLDITRAREQLGYRPQWGVRRVVEQIAADLRTTVPA
jgi:nucleoside-diphosphate-sugar epimerase